jgi:hypothetical protein
MPQSKKVDADSLNSLNVGEEKLADVERLASGLTWLRLTDDRSPQKPDTSGYSRNSLLWARLCENEI